MCSGTWTMGPLLDCCAILCGVCNDAGRDWELGEGGSAENVMEVPVLSRAGPPPVDAVRMCGNLCACEGTALVGACAMCAIPPPFKSMLSSVVGFVLAAILRNVRGSER